MLATSIVPLFLISLYRSSSSRSEYFYDFTHLLLNIQIAKCLLFLFYFSWTHLHIYLSMYLKMLNTRYSPLQFTRLLVTLHYNYIFMQMDDNFSIFKSLCLLQILTKHFYRFKQHS